MKTFGVGELKEHLDEILRLIEEEGETIDVTKRGKVIAHLIPASEQKSSVAESDAAAWEKLKRIASELSPYWPENTGAVDIVRDVRRDL